MYIPELFPARRTRLLAQLVHSPLQILACPMRPGGGVFAQQVAGQGAVAGRVLHVDVQVGAAHGDDDIEVDLHIVRNAFLDGEGLCGCAGEPARYFAPREVDACEDEGYCPGGGVTALDKVCLFGFSCYIAVSLRFVTSGCT